MFHKTRNTRLFTYLTASAALGGGVAQSAIVYQSFETVLSDPSIEVISTSSVTGAIQFNGSAITLGNTSGSGLVLTADDSLKVDTVLTTTQGGRQAVGGYLQTVGTLAPLTLISPGFTAAGGGQTGFGADAVSNEIVGVSTPEGYLGWVRYSHSGGAGTVTVHDAAFENVAGQAIQAGAVPEASSMALAGLAGGLALLRRRRAA